MSGTPRPSWPWCTEAAGRSPAERERQGGEAAEGVVEAAARLARWRQGLYLAGERLQQDLALQPGERGTDAGVDAVAEGDVPDGAAGDVEPFRVGPVPGVPVGDTLKRVAADGGVEETVSRDGLWAIQTPQAFAADTFRRAFSVNNAVLQATDCAGHVEAAGGRVKVVEGDPRLLKVTTAADLERVAELRS